MHGRKRSLRDKVTKEEQEKTFQKVFELRLLVSSACKRYADMDLSQDSMRVTATVLTQHPELYSLWNFRRKIISQEIGDMRRQYSSKEGEEEEESTRKSELVKALQMIIKAEMELTFVALSQKNPKSYCAWYQRKWLIDYVDQMLRQLSTASDGIALLEVFDFDRELKLCAKLLAVDERNFHCWNYRNFLLDKKYREVAVVPTGGQEEGGDRGNKRLQEELQDTASLIQTNFSNFSAWHRRIVLLSPLLKSSIGEVLLGKHPVYHLKADLDLVHNAIFTEPADQSAWIYYEFLMDHLLNWLAGSEDDDTRAKIIALVISELGICYELFEVEPTAKFNLLCMVNVYLKLQTEVEALLTITAQASWFTASTVSTHIDKLQEIDEDHEQYYKHLQRQLQSVM